MRRAEGVDVTVDQSRTGPRGSSSLAWVVAALVPTLILPVGLFAAPHYLDPIFHKAPTVLGLPIGVVVVSVSAGWFAVGVTLIAMASSRVTRLLAFLFFIIPAIVAVVLGPGMVLILENLSAQAGT